jgi:transcription elongation GreA/GreB family factor
MQSFDKPAASDGRMNHSLPRGLRDQIVAALGRLRDGRLAECRADEASIPAACDAREADARFLNHVLAGLEDVAGDALPTTGAGFGSSLVVRDVELGVDESYTLMTGPMLDIAAGHVSLASPVGRALLGAQPGDTVLVDTPQRRRRLHVAAVRTLQEKIRDGLAQLDGAEKGG